MLLLYVLSFFVVIPLLNGGIMKVNYSISKIPPNLPLTFGLPSSHLGIVCKQPLLSVCRRLQREACRYIAILATSLH